MTKERIQTFIWTVIFVLTAHSVEATEADSNVNPMDYTPEVFESSLWFLAVLLFIGFLLFFASARSSSSNINRDATRKQRSKKGKQTSSNRSSQTSDNSWLLMNSLADSSTDTNSSSDCVGDGSSDCASGFDGGGDSGCSGLD